MSESPEQVEAKEPIHLKDPVLAAFLAWLLPGLGHLYQGRKAKAVLFCVCILGTFVYGLYLGGSPDLGWGRAVFFRWKPEKRLPYLCQVGVGLPALPALIQASRMNAGKEVLWHGFMAPPRREFGGHDENQPHANANQPTENELHRILHRYFELGTVYTMIAGLLNVLAIYDAWAGPVFPETENDEEDEDEVDESVPRDE